MALQAALAAGSALLGAGQYFSERAKAKRVQRDMKRLFSQRKAYQTPQELLDIANLRLANTQGFSDQTMSYLTGEADAALATGVGTATRLGADPNQIGGVLDQYYRQIAGIGTQSDLAKMGQIDAVANAIGVLAQSREAEQVSADNLIKDQLQGKYAELGLANQGMTSGANFAIQGLSNLALLDLYGEGDIFAGKGKKTGTTGGATGGTTGGAAGNRAALEARAISLSQATGIPIEEARKRVGIIDY